MAMPTASTLRRAASLALLAVLWASTPALGQTLNVPMQAVDAVAAHVRARAMTLGLDPADVADLVVSDGHVGANGIAFVYLRQRLDGLDVVGSQIAGAVGADGRLILSLIHI